MKFLLYFHETESCVSKLLSKVEISEDNYEEKYQYLISNGFKVRWRSRLELDVYLKSTNNYQSIDVMKNKLMIFKLNFGGK